MNRIKLSKLDAETLAKMPEWLTLKKDERDAVENYRFFLFNVIRKYSKAEVKEAYEDYDFNKICNPEKDEAFSKYYFTDEMIKVGYKKNPEDKMKNGMTYREGMNALYYKAFNDNRGKYEEFEKLERDIMIKSIVKSL